MANEQESGFRLGTVGGTPVVLRRSWFLIAVVLAFLVGPTILARVPDIGTTAAYLAALGFAGLLLGSVFLHELAHAVAARAVGTPPTVIVLDLWGGHTAFDREAPTAGRSVLVAGVGPLTNGLIAVLAFLAYRALPEGTLLAVLALLVTWSNGFVAVLNALPGLPLDGGRVLEGLIWAVSGRRSTGTLVAGWIGRAVALGVVLVFVVLPFLQGNGVGVITAVWVAAIAWMLWQGASQAIRYAGWQRIASSVTAGRLMVRAVAVPTSATAADAQAAWAGAQGPAPDTPVAVVVVDEAGRPVAVLDGPALRSVPPERAPFTGVGAVARPLPSEVLAPHLAGDDLVARIQALGAPEYAVVDGGRVVGVLHWQAVAQAVAGR